MQYIDWDYACKNNCIKEAMVSWLKDKKHISWFAKHHIFLMWRMGKHSLIIGERPSVIDEKDLKNHYEKNYHKKSYVQKYLERNLFKL